ncbi:hypothetical protein FC093_10955 [Ilyomonas limi]|jgi:hypothetical protein|uniref:Uncharacterized protein n=1 Tax=Ilyomonas limi TaxID=2575867 RepID=A0A4U3L4W4_9BACT|nr:hypothetical protein [Ilyomonas limi]TKK68627.1 hypothetical protein FC093_10955 [Ilyomonas limi]
MKRLVGLMVLVTCFVIHGKAQQIESIEFHLYTDSLKKGVHNYINVDGKLGDGNWRPLNSKLIQFSSNAGTWDGNNLIIDSSYNKDSVVVTAVLKGNTALQKTVTIYMKRNLVGERLKTEEELMKEWDNNSGKKGRKRGN